MSEFWLLCIQINSTNISSSGYASLVKKEKFSEIQKVYLQVYHYQPYTLLKLTILVKHCIILICFKY